MENQKKTRIVRALRIIMPIVAVIITVIIAPLDLIPPLIAPLPDTVQEQVDDAIDYRLDGIIVYVDQGGQPPAFYTAGWKNKLTQEPADPHAFFKIGSIHKLYIATAVAKLASNGSLSLDETLADYFPEFVGRIEYADEITIRMMVQHRSGIPNFTDDSEFDWFTPLTDDDEILELIFDDPADFEPDTRYSYSNTNYFLLGRILDKVLGYSHHQYVYNEILAPLGLTHTYFTLDEVEFDNVVSGYWYDYDDDLRFLGGSMVATAEDVGMFLRALNDGSLLNDDEQAIYSSIYEYQHDGWVPGYHSKAHYYEDIDTVVVQFVSTTGGETWGTANIIGGKATAISNIIYNRIVRILHRR
ncbi:MAG: serine hydrolase domain-containing protein [Desulfatiglandaceae bacterium]